MKNIPFLSLILVPAMTCAAAPIVPFGGATTTPTTHSSHPPSSAAPAPPQTTTPPPVSYPKVIIPPSDRSTSKFPIPGQLGGQTGQSASGELFFYPGVVSAKDGRWTGGDNFLNLSKSIAVQVNFIKAEGVSISFTQEKFQGFISSIFDKNGLTPNASTSPPLPFFNLIVMIFPTESGLAAACQGRLFEQVQVSRVQLKDEVFQAITWEQTHLVFGAADEFEKMLTDTVEALVNTFVTRVAAHQAASK